MNSNFPIEFVRSATGGVSWQTSTDVWKRREFFSSIKTSCFGHEYDEKTAEAQANVNAQIEEALEDLKNRVRATGATPVDGTADPTPYAEPYQQQRREPEESPFKVTAAPHAPQTDSSTAATNAALSVQTDPTSAAEQAQKDRFAQGKPETEPLQTGAPEPHLRYQPANDRSTRGETLGIQPDIASSGTSSGFDSPSFKAIAKKEATKPRGRRKAEPKPEGPAAMEALKASAPPEAVIAPSPEVRAVYQATLADLPPNIAAAPHEPQAVAPTPPKSQVERLKAIEAMLLKEHKGQTEERVGQSLRAFVKAFLLVSTLPKPPDPAYEQNLPLFESFARNFGKEMLSNPVEEGEKAGASWGRLVRHIDTWPVGYKVLVKQLATFHYPDATTDLLEFLDGDGLREPNENMWTFLQLLRIGRNALLPVRDAAKKRGCSLSAVIGNLDLDLADEKAVLSTIAGGAVQSGAQA